MEQLDFIRNGGETRRFHTVAVLREQRVDGHSWGVAMLAWVMYGQLEPGIRVPLLMAALTHDLAEHKVGDLPAPAKRNMEARLELKGAQTFRAAWGQMEGDILDEVDLNFEKELTVDELRKLNLCDAMEGALYCIRERAMGNTLITPCFLNFRKYIEGELEQENRSDDGNTDPATHSDMEWEVLHYINTQWELVNGG